MNFKISGRYIITVAITVILVVFLNFIIVIGFALSTDRVNDSMAREDKIFLPEDFTIEFAKYIHYQGGNIYINQDGKDLLKSHNAWIQVVDENGKEVYNYKKPTVVRDNYRPIDLIQAYKYSLEESMSTIFIWEKDLGDINYNYIIGFPFKEIGRNVLTYDNKKLIKVIEKIIYMVLLIDIPIALLFAYLFSRRLTKPLVGIIGDITELSHGNYSVERKEKGIYKEVNSNINKLSAQLKFSKEERKKLDAMREEWISNISHDIKTPLVSIKGYAEILSSEEYDLTKEEIEEYTKIIEDKSNYIKELIDDLNLSTRLKNQAFTLNLEKVNIVSLVRKVIIDILNNPNTNQVHIEFLPDKEVIEKFVDEALIKRVISNILYNSIIHNDESVSIKVIIKEKDKLSISIIDNGKGINEEELEHILDRYYRGTNTNKGHEGSGLGMAIANDIVIAHNGSIDIKSQLGLGTEVKILLF